MAIYTYVSRRTIHKLHMCSACMYACNCVLTRHKTQEYRMCTRTRIVWLRNVRAFIFHIPYGYERVFIHTIANTSQISAISAGLHKYRRIKRTHIRFTRELKKASALEKTDGTKRYKKLRTSEHAAAHFDGRLPCTCTRGLKY
jgi:hypothetical protein